MASRRKGWDNLSPGYRKRLESKGITKARYDRGHKLDVARGHAETPEHGLRQAKKHPVKYRKYLEKKERLKGGGGLKTPEEEARELNAAKDAAYYNFKGRLGDYFQYNDGTVLANIYGGITSESGKVSGMSLPEANWTANADTEQLRSRAHEQYKANPWWYH
jgi:hypothetical protein